MIKIVLLSALLLMAIVVTQQAKAQTIDDFVKRGRQINNDLKNFLDQVRKKEEKCNDAENITQCKIDVMAQIDNDSARCVKDTGLTYAECHDKVMEQP
jgi:CRISPR/Cas system CSM-associated protein Csm2 small subunit